ncbi:hypothetical protein [Porphyrobacter sp. YT40]|uniref:hypothetical protein n=1 Tax=Porphyrobacter sp. YT40 TaxID=2547601 RepID=UPI0011422356|nr:hypothetical protein [Porphyrobacter sp. YT40]QDH34688.1 hypothetical protein E2E27_10365 [Porphyrobacter sp. YT40]
MAERKFKKRLIFQIVIPRPWPVEQQHDFQELQIPEGRLFVSALPDKRLEVWFLAEEPIEFGKFRGWHKGKLRTIGIEAREGIKILAEIVVENDAISEFLLQGRSILQTGSADAVRIDANPLPSENYPADYWEIGNEACRQKRIERLRGLKSNVYRDHPGPMYDFDALAMELMQLQDLVAAVEQGAEYHVPGLLARNRALLYEKTKLGLVQLCAAHIGTTCKFPFRPQINAENLVRFKKGIFLVPLSCLSDDIRDDFPQIDIDNWLDQVGLIFDGKTVSNRQVVQDLGNGLGAHRMPSSNEVTKLLAGRPQLFANSEQIMAVRFNDVSRVALEVAYLLIRVVPPLIGEFHNSRT